ncbi:hypothetical protein F4803DRAFT_555489 [Xylaria telfairii]|nr:hypothetical protein F4803DRAFT_555489 [Xylaria telfairii]
MASSPWAARFPLEVYTLSSEDERHSLLAPRVPRIDDPMYYDQDPAMPPNYPPLTPEELDELFYAETIQSELYGGMTTWELAALNRHIRFSPETGFLSGGHRPIDRATVGLASRVPQIMVPGPSLGLRLPIPIRTNEERDFAVYLRERIEVDENRWFSFICKEKWYDWIQVSETFEHPAGETWSVDDPKIWGMLRIVLELVDRMLKALIEDRNKGGMWKTFSFSGAVELGLRTILYGRIDYWENFVDIFGPEPSSMDLPSVLISYETEQRIARLRGIPCEWDFILKKTSQDWIDRLYVLFKGLLWGFREDPGVEAQCHVLPVVNDSGVDYTAMILISLPRLQTMLHSKLTLAELCNAQTHLAMVIIHELMHALLIARYWDDSYKGNCLDALKEGPSGPDEPYLDGVGLPEVGHYMEQQFFGGCAILHLVVFGDFPWPGCTRHECPAPNCPSLQPGATVTAHITPAAWAAKMLSESFWQDPAYPMKSANSFHRNSVFFADAIVGAMGQPDAQARSLDTLPFQYPEDAMALDAWDERNRIWDSYRQGWYFDARMEWDDSPWGRSFVRDKLEEFAVGFERRDLLKCNSAAWELIASIPTNRDRQTFLDHLPLNRRKDPHWAWHAIGLLMLASIPRAMIAMTRGTNRGSYFLHLTPSRAATAEGTSLPVYIVVHDTSDEGMLHSRLHTLYNALEDKGALPDYTQRTCLGLLTNMLTFIMENEGIVHGRLFDTILAAHNALYEDRKAIAMSYPEVPVWTSKWASRWFFKFPAYDTTYRQFMPNGMDPIDLN